jgi:FkbM family methyltransferase
VEPLLPIRPAQALVRSAVSNSASCSVLNRTYNALSWKHKRYFWRLLGDAFGNRTAGTGDSDWKVVFGAREIRLPLEADRMWLDWLLAVSFLGHDAEVKQTYLAFLTSKQRPDLFVDVGANYGPNSLIFLVHGVRTISFEPNPACHDYFRECGRLNGVAVDIRDVVVGDSHNTVDLLFAERETWNGSAEPEVQKRLRETAGGQLLKVSAAQVTLDEALAADPASRILVKIDTEGFEDRVLRGARRLLETRKPSVIFEAWPEASVRGHLFAILAEVGYAVFPLPWTGSAGRPLSQGEFETAIGMNFIALPAKDGGPG